MNYTGGGGGDGVTGTNNPELEKEDGNEAKILIGSSIVLIVLSTIFVVLRLVSRKLSKAGFWVNYYAFPNFFFFFCRMD